MKAAVWITDPDSGFFARQNQKKFQNLPKNHGGPQHEEEHHPAAAGRPHGRRHVPDHGRLRQQDLTGKGVTCQRYSFSDSNDVAAVTTKAAADSDVIYIPTDNTAAANTEAIANVLIPAGVPAICGEEGICSGCGVATLSISYYDLGKTTGQMAARILTGEADISTMPIEYTTATPKYNPTICEALGITPLDGYTAIED